MKLTDDNGTTHCAKELARSQGVEYNTLIYRRRRGWSDAEIIAGERRKVSKNRLMAFKDQIVAMRTAGDNLADIGERFGTDSGNISRFLRQVGFDNRLVNNNLNLERADNVARLRSQGFSISRIAKELGVTESAVQHYFQKLNLPKLGKRVYSAAELEKRRLAKNKRLAEWRKRHKVKNANKRIERRNADPVFAIKDRVRAVTRYAFKRKGWGKGTQTHNLLGCDWLELKARIESLFTTGMRWDNMGEWHIDHKIPLASASTVEELRALCRFTNLQPLWARENLSKGARIYTKHAGVSESLSDANTDEAAA